MLLIELPLHRFMIDDCSTSVQFDNSEVCFSKTKLVYKLTKVRIVEVLVTIPSKWVGVNTTDCVFKLHQL